MSEGVDAPVSAVNYGHNAPIGSTTEMEFTPTEKLDAKVANEQLKLFASLLNTLAASALIGSLVAP